MTRQALSRRDFDQTTHLRGLNLAFVSILSLQPASFGVFSLLTLSACLSLSLFLQFGSSQQEPFFANFAGVCLLVPEKTELFITSARVQQVNAPRLLSPLSRNLLGT